MTPNSKKKVLEVLRWLPADATLEDVIERLYLLAKVERALAEADTGEIVPHANAKQRLSRDRAF